MFRKARRQLLNFLHERQNEFAGGAGSVLQVQAGAQSSVQHCLHRVQIGTRSLGTASRREFVKGVVIAGTGEHSRFTHAQPGHQIGILAGRPNPGGRFYRILPATPALQRPFQHGAVSWAVHKKLGLPQRPTVSGKCAHQVVNFQAILCCQGKAALLPITVGRLGCPGVGRQVWRLLTLPDIVGQAISRKSGGK